MYLSAMLKYSLKTELTGPLSFIYNNRTIYICVKKIKLYETKKVYHSLHHILITYHLLHLLTTLEYCVCVFS